HDFGADPSEVLAALAEFIHLVTRIKLVPDAANDISLTPEERTRGMLFSQRLSMPVLTRAWQLLLKGIREVKNSPRPLIAADMVLVQIGFAADLPTSGEAIRKLIPAASGGTPATMEVETGARASAAAGNASVALASAPKPSAALPSITLSCFEDVVALAGRHRDISLQLALERDVHLARFEQGRIELSLAPGASPGLVSRLMSRLQEWTGSRWLVAVSNLPGAPSLKEQR